MVSIRENVFESNSSSVHSLTLCSKQAFEEWQKKQRYVCDESKPLTAAEIFKMFTEKLPERIKSNKEYVEKYPDSNWVKDQIVREEKVVAENYTEETFSITLKNLFEIEEIQQNGITERVFDELDENIDHYNLLVALSDTLGEIFDYESYFNYIEEDYESFVEDEEIEGVPVVAFGYFGHD